MVKLAFWIIVSFSDGQYNKGNMDQLDVQFPTEESCQYTLDQLEEIANAEWGRINMGCVEVVL